MTDINYMTDLKVEVQVPTEGLQNLIKNPSGEQGAWGWESPVANTFMSGSQGNVVGQKDIYFQTNPTQACYFRSEFLTVAAGKYAVARFDLAQISASHNVKVRFEWYNSAKALLSSSTQSAAMSAIQTHYLSAALAPANTAYAKLRFDFYNGAGNPSISSWVRVRQVMVATAATSGGFGSIRENVFTDPASTSAGSWAAPASTTSVVTHGTYPAWNGTTSFRMNQGAAFATDIHAESVSMAVTAGEYYTSSVYVRSAATSRIAHAAIQWYVDGAWQGTYQGTGVTTSTSMWLRPSITMRAPAGATAARLRVTIKGVPSGEYHYFDGILFEQTNIVAQPYFDGATTDVTNLTYDWAGTANASKSTATYASAGFAYQPFDTWLTITGSVQNVDIDREAMNLGTMTVTIKDQLLDPAGVYDAILKPGKQIRVQARDGSTWKNLYTGKINNAHVDYDKKKKANAEVESLITISAIDAMSDLANQGESRCVDAIGSLTYLLEGKGVPWNCNADTSHYNGTPTIPVLNDNLSVADQIVITRDTKRAKAWVDKDGVLNAFEDNIYDLVGIGITNEWLMSDYTIDPLYNHMPHHDFEAGSATFIGNVKTTVSRTAAAAYDGSFGLRATCAVVGSMSMWVPYVGAGVIEVPHDGEYELSFYVRSNKASAVLEMVYPVPYSFVTLPATPNTWQWVSKTVTPYLNGDGKYVIDIEFGMYGAGWSNLAIGDTFDFDYFMIMAEEDDAIHYSEIDVDWDTDRIMNQVEIKHLTPNADGQAEEVPAGTWEDAASVAAYGPKRAVFTVVGSQNLTTFATNILSANATPTIRVNSLTVPIKTLDRLSFAANVDLMDEITVRFDDKVDEVYCVDSISHRIGLDGWFVDITFATTTSNAAPQYTPAPPVTVYDAVDVTNLAIAGVAGVTSTSLLTRRGNTVDLYIALSHVGAVNANTATLVIPSQHLPINGNNKYFAGMDGATGGLVQVYFASNFYFVFNRAAGSATYAHITYLAGP